MLPYQHAYVSVFLASLGSAVLLRHCLAETEALFSEHTLKAFAVKRQKTQSHNLIPQLQQLQTPPNITLPLGRMEMCIIKLSFQPYAMQATHGFSQCTQRT